MSKKKNKTGLCHNAKCEKELNGNFIYMMYGGMEKHDEMTSSMSGEIECFLDIGVHSHEAENFGSVDLHSKAQFNHGSQGESYFCSKQCFIDWITRKIKNLSDPTPQGN